MTETTITRRKQKEERREQILDAALRVFAEKGFAGASMRDIARLIGVTEGLLYHYFESKEDLLNTCWRERTWRAHLERNLVEAEGKSVETVLRDLIRDFLQTLRDNGEMVRFCATEKQRNPDLVDCHLRKIEENHDLLCEFLRKRQEAGEMRRSASVSAATGLLMGCAYSLFLLYGEQAEPIWGPMAEGFIETGVDVVMHGIRADGPS